MIPQWIQDYLGIRKTESAFSHVNKNWKVSNIRYSPYNTITHKICNKCNNGWLCDIDAAGKEFLKSLMINPNSKPETLSQELLSDEVRKIFTLVYKIFLNFIATSPFKETKTSLHRDFYKRKTPPAGVSLFYSLICAPKAISMGHLDMWITTVTPGQAWLSRSMEPEKRFKFFLQLGSLALVACCTGGKNAKILYDPAIILPIIDSGSIPFKYSLSPPPPPLADTPVNRILCSIGMEIS